MLEGLSIRKICREAWFVLVFALVVEGMKLLDGKKGVALDLRLALESGIYCLKLLAAFLSARLVYASTSLSELRDASTRIARRLPFGKKLDFGLALSLTIGYVPLIFDEWKASLEAARSRGMSPRPGLGILAHFLAHFLAAFLRRLMIRAVVLPEALVARGWTQNRGVAESHWRRRDSCTLVASLACLVLGLLRIV